MDNRGQVDTFILDFVKAFETPPHELKRKLFGYGIDGKTTTSCCKWSKIRLGPSFVGCPPGHFSWSLVVFSLHIRYWVWNNTFADYDNISPFKSHDFRADNQRAQNTLLHMQNLGYRLKYSHKYVINTVIQHSNSLGGFSRFCRVHYYTVTLPVHLFLTMKSPEHSQIWILKMPTMSRPNCGIIQ